MRNFDLELAAKPDIAGSSRIISELGMGPLSFTFIPSLYLLYIVLLYIYNNTIYNYPRSKSSTTASQS
jgi:hypothetical protein